MGLGEERTPLSNITWIKLYFVAVISRQALAGPAAFQELVPSCGRRAGLWGVSALSQQLEHPQSFLGPHRDWNLASHRDVGWPEQSTHSTSWGTSFLFQKLCNCSLHPLVLWVCTDLGSFLGLKPAKVKGEAL